MAEKESSDDEVRVLKVSSDMNGEIITEVIKGHDEEESCKPGTWEGTRLGRLEVSLQPKGTVGRIAVALRYDTFRAGIDVATPNFTHPNYI